MGSISQRFGNLSPLKQALLALEEMGARLAKSERERLEPIAIIGMGCRFPGAEDTAAFWRLMGNGVDAVKEVPSSRWSLEDFYDADPDAPGKMSTRWAGLLDSIDQFDPEFFGISPREAVAMDPQQRLLLEVAWEALENAGQGPRALALGQTGVFIGMTGDEYAQLFYQSGDLSMFNTYFASGIARSVASGRISYVLGLQGPNLSIDTACSSSLVAVHTACLNLRMGECRVAIAGGSNIVLAPEIGIAFSKAHMMAPDGRCKAFDSRADGFVRGEGCGIVVLKRLSDALADSDNILAVIRGSAVNQDGRSGGLTVPSAKAQESVIRQALANGGVKAEEIGYVEAHGTGTSLGDPIEAHALAAVMGPGRTQENPLVVGSVKTNVGHLESAAGVAGLIKVVLSLQHGQIPANLHFQKMNPHIDWGGVPVEIPVAARPWPQGAKKRIAGVSAFGFSGTNAHLVVEEAPAREKKKRELERSQHILALSGRSETALRELTERYEQELGKTAEELGDICYTANAGRAHFEHRLAVVGGTVEEVRKKLGERKTGVEVQERGGMRPVFLFSGQGSQYAGMGKQLYETQGIFRKGIEECEELLKGELEKPLREVLWGGATELLDETAYTQPALFAMEYGIAEMWKSWGIEPGVVLGHSVGEYVAACVAGVYSLADGLKLIAARGRLMQGVKGQGAMAAAMCGEEGVREALQGLEERVSIAGMNAPESVVISGYAEEVGIAEERLKKAGVRVQRLAVSHGFHSPQMGEMEEEFEAIAGKIEYAAPKVKLISSVTGKEVARGEITAKYWRGQVREPVRFQKAMETLRELGQQVYVEVGAGTTLVGLGRQCQENGSEKESGKPERLWVVTMRKGRGEWEQVLESLGRMYERGAEVDWEGFDRGYGRRRVALPTYPFQRQRYWIENKSAQRVAVTARRSVEQNLSGQDLGVEAKDETLHGKHGALFEVRWHRLPRPVVAKDHANSLTGNWLIVADRTGTGAGLAKKLSAAGAKCTIWNSDAEGKSILQSRSWHGVVYLRALDAPTSEELTSDMLPSCLSPSCRGLLDLVQHLASGQGDCPPRLWLVTQGAEFVSHEQQTIAILQSPLLGMSQAIRDEHPEWHCSCVDLDPKNSSRAVDCLSDEIQAGDTEDQVAFRGDERFVSRLEMRTDQQGLDSAQQKSTAAFDARAWGKRGAEISANGTYLIAGGLGALGLQVARWLVARGARDVVLVGRSKPSAQAQQLVAWAEANGARVHVQRADISRMEDAKRVLSEVSRTMPPLRGIVHAAAVLDDGVLTQQTWDRFERVFAPKVSGAWALHELTADSPLDFFVLFSSAASLLGAPGQANYAAANAFEDALAHHRRLLGKPAISINWGAWSEGLAVREGLGKRQSELGITAMSPEAGLALLDSILRENPAQIGAGFFDWSKFLRRYPGNSLPRRFSNLLQLDGEQEVRESGESELLMRLNAAPESDRMTVLRDFIQELAVRILGFSSGRRLNLEQPLNELGLDSLMAVEFRNALAAAVGHFIPTTLLFSYPAIQDLTLFAAALLLDETKPESGAQTGGDSSDVLGNIEDLTDEEVERMLTTGRKDSL